MPLYSKKAYLIFVLQILKEYTDELHPMMQKDIVTKIKELYSCDIDRKTISSLIDTLNEFDEYEIVQIPNKGYYLQSRDLDPTQVKYLIDAIYSSKIITGKQAKEMVDVLSNDYLSLYQRKNYSYIYKSTEINRSINQEFFLNIDIINKAIKEDKRISFKYIDYDKYGNKTNKYNGYRYKVSPYYLINNYGKYYLLCKYYKGDISVFRIDFMEDVLIEDKPRIPLESLEGFNKFNISSYINDHVYMFSSKLINATLEINHPTSIRDIKDWFGNNAKIYCKDDKTYASIKCDEMALLYWCLQYISAVKVIEPIEFKNKIIEILKTNLNKYIEN